MMISWYWIPVSFEVGFLFGVLIVSVLVAARRG